VKQLFSVCVLKQVCIFKRFLFIYSPVNSFKKRDTRMWFSGRECMACSRHWVPTVQKKKKKKKINFKNAIMQTTLQRKDGKT
jgi:hypothetical protein